MSLSTFSEFYYGFHIDSTNNTINIDEGSGELIATIATGSYSLSEFIIAISTALDNASTLPQSYTVSVDRTTRLITIASTANFSINIGTGAQKGISPYTLMGFTGGVDLTGSNTYTGISGTGFSYRPQFLLQSYVDSDHSQEKISPTVNESASGDIEVVSFGTRKFIEFNMLFINDYVQDNNVIKYNKNGIADAVSFLQDIIKKGSFEFMPNIDNSTAFFKVILESTQSSGSGVGYKLIEMTKNNLPGYYESGIIKLRVVT